MDKAQTNNWQDPIPSRKKWFFSHQLRSSGCDPTYPHSAVPNWIGRHQALPQPTAALLRTHFSVLEHRGWAEIKNHFEIKTNRRLLITTINWINRQHTEGSFFLIIFRLRPRKKTERQQKIQFWDVAKSSPRIKWWLNENFMRAFSSRLLIISLLRGCCFFCLPSSCASANVVEWQSCQARLFFLGVYKESQN